MSHTKKPSLEAVLNKIAYRRDTSRGSEDSNGPAPRFSKGIISIKYKKSPPMRLVSPPAERKAGECSSQNLTQEPTNSISVAAQDESKEEPQRYFKEQPDRGNPKYSWNRPPPLSRNEGIAESTCLMSVNQLNNRRRQ